MQLSALHNPNKYKIAAIEMTEQQSPSSDNTPSDDFFLYDTDQLNAVAGEASIRQGLVWLATIG